MSDQSQHPEPAAIAPRDLEPPASETEAVRGGFLGGLVRRAAPAVRPVGSVAADVAPSTPPPPPAE